jgi:signal peptidase I
MLDRSPERLPQTSYPEEPVAPPPAPARRRRGLLRELIEMAAIVLVIFLAVRLFFQPYAVDGASMTPNLQDGERVFVNRTAYVHLDAHALWDVMPWVNGEDDGLYQAGEPRRGDIVVIDSDQTRTDDQYIKRVIGLPGETITFHEGLVFVDDEPLVEDYIDGAITECHPNQYCHVTVPDGYVYVLGDNRTNSEDSRYFGAIPFGDIVGRAIFSNWPPSTFGPIHHPDYNEPATAP